MQPPTVPWLSDAAYSIMTDEAVPLGINTYVRYGDYVFPAAVSLKFQVEPMMDLQTDCTAASRAYRMRV